ncbi:MAG: MBL fold metallo-hydrolase [Chloroflexi bacterium]|nr:MBL fold metallo-hydrolase [Chloroflexota bacterium]
MHVPSDGVYRQDGGTLFGLLPKSRWEQMVKADTRNRVRLGLNCLLIKTPGANILVDAGAGTKANEEKQELYALNSGKLMSSLRELGLSAKDIHYVVLTHLHFDHAGGATKFNRKREAVPTFPKARYVVQETAWKDAAHPNERGKDSYNPEDFLPLRERKQLELVNGDVELVSGVWLKLTNGHCRGHQMVFLNHAAKKLACFGDLVPTPYHIPIHHIPADDQFPEETLLCKRELLKLAERDRWLIVFPHGYHIQAGYLERNGTRMAVQPVKF